MATPNIVPRADSEGGLGTASKYWASAYIDKILTTGKVGIGIAAPVSRLHIYEDSTESGENAGITVEQDGTGDATIQFLLTGTRRWATGIDNSNSDAFTIASSGDLGSDGVLTLSTGGNATFAGDITTSSGNPFVTIEGNSAGYVNGGIQFISNHASDDRGLGTFYYNAHTDVEWFAGLPYSSNDAFVINRNASYTAPSSESSPAGIGASAGTLFSISSSGNATFAGAVNVSGEALTVTSGNSEKPLLHLKATNNSAAGPHIKFEVDRGAAPAVGDDLGTILWAGEDSNQNVHHYAKILGEILNPASTDEAGRLTLFVGESDGTTADLSPGLKLEGSSSVDGEVNVTLGNASTSKTSIPGRLGVGANSTDVEAALTIKGDPGNTNQPAKITNSAQDIHTGLFLNSTGNAANEKYGMQFGGHNEYSVGGIFGLMDSAVGSTSGDITIDMCDGTTTNALIERVRFTHEGAVGIGTSTPQRKLEVFSSTSSSLIDTHIGGTYSVTNYQGLSFGYAESGNLNYRHSALVFERDDAGTGDATGNVHILNSVTGSGATSADLADAKLSLLKTGSAILAGIPFYSSGGNSMYTHDVSATDDTAANNTSYGFGAMDAITTGDNNTAIGYAAGGALSTGENNTALGHSAGAAVQTGLYNTIVGGEALSTNIDGDNNTAIGYQAMKTFEADTDGHGGNTAVGAKAMRDATTGENNTAIGVLALGDGILTGDNNVGIGTNAGMLLAGGGENVIIGVAAGDALTSGNQNVVVGRNAGGGISSAHGNVAVGYQALLNEDTQGYATAVGFHALKNQNADALTYNVAVGYAAAEGGTSGRYNIAMGGEAMYLNQDGDANTAVGYKAMKRFEADTDGHGENTAFGAYAMRGDDTTPGTSTGTQNTAIGANAMKEGVLTGDHNTAVGQNAAKTLTSGVQNVIIGSDAGDALTEGNHNVALGFRALSGEDTGNNSTAIGYYALNKQNNNSNNYNIAIGHSSQQENVIGVYNTTIGGLTGTAMNDADYNVLIGMQAGTSLTTAGHNTAIGTFSLYTEDTRGYNTAVGYDTLRYQNAGADTYSTAVGFQSSRNNRTGVKNTTVGGYAGLGILTGDFNVAVGHKALHTAGAGNRSTAIGYQALESQFTTFTRDSASTTAGDATVTFPAESRVVTGLKVDVTTGTDQIPADTFVGAVSTGSPNSTFEMVDVNGSAVVATGSGTVSSLTLTFTGGQDAGNTAVGYSAGTNVTTGISNTIVGALAGDAATTGNLNTLLGYQAADAMTIGGNNTAIGAGALDDLTEGVNNVALGQAAGDTVTTGSNNIYLGRSTIASSTGVNSEIVIGEGLTGLGSGTTRIGGNIQISDLTPTFSAITDSSITLVSGTEYLVNDANGGAMVLPSAGQGKRIIINIGTKITSNTLTITAASGDLLKGFAFLEQTEDGSANAKTMFQPDGSDDLIITLNGSTKGGLVGDKIECVGISTTEWRVRAILQHTGTAATPFS